MRRGAGNAERIAVGAQDDHGPLTRAFAVDAIPFSLVVDRGGRVAGQGLHGPALEALVDHLLARRVVRRATGVEDEEGRLRRQASGPSLFVDPSHR